MAPVPSPPASFHTPQLNIPSFAAERLTWLSTLPVAATALYYAISYRWQAVTAVQFAPQILTYLVLILWARGNSRSIERMGLAPVLIREGFRWGLAIGVLLGTVNVAVIFWFVPWLGGDILFLLKTPHAQIPVVVMLPWFILLIAAVIEINFRGFLLGRLLALFSGRTPRRYARIQESVAVAISALTFSFDPFMVMTFKHLHWIALWDGLIWGALWVRFRNLYIPILAHAAEVIVMYIVLRNVLA